MEEKELSRADRPGFDHSDAEPVLLNPSLQDVDDCIRKILADPNLGEIAAGFHSAEPFLQHAWKEKEGAVQLSLACGFTAVMKKHGFKVTREHKSRYMVVAWWTDGRGVRHCRIRYPESYRYHLSDSYGFWGMVYRERASRLINHQNKRINRTIRKSLGENRNGELCWGRHVWLQRPRDGMAVVMEEKGLSSTNVSCVIYVQDVPGKVWLSRYRVKRRIPATMVRECIQAAVRFFDDDRSGDTRLAYPLAYMRLKGIPEDSPEGQQILGHAVMTRL